MKTKTLLDILKFIVLIYFLSYLFQFLAALSFGVFTVFKIGWSGLQNFIVDVGDILITVNNADDTSTLLVIIGTIGMLPFKVYLCYLLWKILKNINVENPFNRKNLNLIMQIGYFSLIAGILLSLISFSVSILDTSEITSKSYLRIENSSYQYVFFALIIFIITQIFRRGVEMQEEQELVV